MHKINNEAIMMVMQITNDAMLRWELQRELKYNENLVHEQEKSKISNAVFATLHPVVKNKSLSSGYFPLGVMSVNGRSK